MTTPDQQARRLAAKCGWYIRKSRTRKHFHSNDHGGYMIADIWTNGAVDGWNFDLSAQDVIEFCERKLQG